MSKILEINDVTTAQFKSNETVYSVTGFGGLPYFNKEVIKPGHLIEVHH